MQTRYEYNSQGFYIGVMVTSLILPNTTDQQPIFTLGFTPQFVNGGWIDQANQFKPGAMPMSQFLMSMTSVERAALRASSDSLVQEFVIMCDRFDAIDTSLAQVQFDVQYSAGLVAAPTGAANAGQPISAPCIGLNGDGAARSAAILAGNILAPGS